MLYICLHTARTQIVFHLLYIEKFNISLKFIKYFNDHIPFHYFSTGSLRCMRQHFLHIMWLHFLILNNYSSLICFWWLYWLEFSSQYLAICKIIDRKFVIFLILLKRFLYFTISILLLLNLWPVTCIVFCSFFIYDYDVDTYFIQVFNLYQ